MPGDSLTIFKSSGENITTLNVPISSPILFTFIEFIFTAFFPSFNIFISIILSSLFYEHLIL